VLDECHKAKNFTPGEEAQSTKVGRLRYSHMSVTLCNVRIRLFCRLLCDMARLCTYVMQRAERSHFLVMQSHPTNHTLAGAAAAAAAVARLRLL
jgi:hypothetical protein